MCLVLFAYRMQPDTPLVVAANRDEFYDRPAKSAHFWPDKPGILAGRDETAGGTWLGINRQGRFAAVTNFAIADLSPPHHTGPQGSVASEGNYATDGGHEPPRRSRGDLPTGFLCGTASGAEYARQVDGLDFQGFNLLLWDGEHLVCTSNRGITRYLEPGYYGLTNAELGVAWPKVTDGIERLRGAMAAGPTGSALIDLLHEDSMPADHRLPHRGRGLQWERRVAPCFIRGEDYGTRASTAVVCTGREVSLTEQGYAAGGMPLERVSFQIEARRLAVTRSSRRETCRG